LYWIRSQLTSAGPH